MIYEVLDVVSMLFYILAAGFLVISLLIFFLLDIRQVIGRMTGSGRRRALARMRRGQYDGFDSTIINMAELEKKPMGTNRRSRKTGRTGRISSGRSQDRDATSGSMRKAPATGQPTSAPSQKMDPHPQPPPEPEPGVTEPIDYFGAPYPNKTPPTPVPETVMLKASGAPDGAVRGDTSVSSPSDTGGYTTALVGGDPGTAVMDEQPGMFAAEDLSQPSAASGLSPDNADAAPEPLEMTILDDCLFIHTETFVELTQ